MALWLVTPANRVHDLLAARAAGGGSRGATKLEVEALAYLFARLRVEPA